MCVKNGQGGDETGNVDGMDSWVAACGWSGDAQRLIALLELSRGILKVHGEGFRL